MPLKKKATFNIGFGIQSVVEFSVFWNSWIIYFPWNVYVKRFKIFLKQLSKRRIRHWLTWHCCRIWYKNRVQLLDRILHWLWYRILSKCRHEHGNSTFELNFTSNSITMLTKWQILNVYKNQFSYPLRFKGVDAALVSFNCSSCYFARQSLLLGLNYVSFQSFFNNILYRNIRFSTCVKRSRVLLEELTGTSCCYYSAPKEPDGYSERMLSFSHN